MTDRNTELPNNNSQQHDLPDTILTITIKHVTSQHRLLMTSLKLRFETTTDKDFLMANESQNYITCA